MGDTLVGQIEWEPPGPGSWALDRSHFPGGTTPISQWLMTESMRAGTERVMAEIGAPIRAVDTRFVHGFMYTRRVPLIRPDHAATKLPPERILRVVSHLHPEFRRRARAARRSLDERPSRAVVADWERRRRPRLLELNLDLQSIDLEALDDRALAAHIGQLLDHARLGAELHFWLHGHDLGPIARFLALCDGWGLDPERAVDALAGASPSTARPGERLVELRAILDDLGIEPRDLDDVRAASPEAEALLDEHLRLHGNVLATGYDVTASTLAELPDLLLDSIRNASVPELPDPSTVRTALRERIPEADLGLFDQALDDARTVMDMRDDNGPMTVEWPVGLLRRALLHAGARLVERGQWSDASLALELTPDEARALLDQPLEPTPLVERRGERLRLASLTPPAMLGPVEPEPSPDVLPAPLPDLVRMIQVSFRHLGMDASSERGDGLSGAGVGTGSYTGTARVVTSAEEALDALTPGDVLVVRATSPAFNVVLSIAGAVVTSDGGAMSHAAVLARELGIPAVVGAADALDIPDGSTVEVDAGAGSVRVVA